MKIRVERVFIDRYHAMSQSGCLSDLQSPVENANNVMVSFFLIILLHLSCNDILYLRFGTQRGPVKKPAPFFKYVL